MKEEDTLSENHNETDSMSGLTGSEEITRIADLQRMNIDSSRNTPATLASTPGIAHQVAHCF